MSRKRLQTTRGCRLESDSLKSTSVDGDRPSDRQEAIKRDRIHIEHVGVERAYLFHFFIGPTTCTSLAGERGGLF